MQLITPRIYKTLFSPLMRNIHNFELFNSLYINLIAIKFYHSHYSFQLHQERFNSLVTSPFDNFQQPIPKKKRRTLKKDSNRHDHAQLLPQTGNTTPPLPRIPLLRVSKNPNGEGGETSKISPVERRKSWQGWVAARHNGIETSTGGQIAGIYRSVSIAAGWTRYWQRGGGPRCGQLR